VGEISKINDIFGGVILDAQPIAEAMKLFGWQQLVGASVLAELNETSHIVVVLCQQSTITIDLIDIPWANDTGVGPGGAPIGRDPF